MKHMFKEEASHCLEVDPVLCHPENATEIDEATSSWSDRARAMPSDRRSWRNGGNAGRWTYSFGGAVDGRGESMMVYG